jgi:hypothetical protein
MKRFAICALTLLLGVSTPSLTAQGAPSPEATARSFLEAWRVGDHLTAARLTDPQELRRNRLLFDSLLAHGQAGYIASRLFELPDSAALLALDDVAFSAGLDRFEDRSGGGREFRVVVTGVEHVGILRQGADTAHAVYRWLYLPTVPPMRTFRALTLVRCRENWCVNVLRDFGGLAKQLAESMVSVPRPPV